MRRERLIAPAGLALLLLCAGVGVGQDKKDAEITRRFIDAMNAMTPVTGEFEVTTTFFQSGIKQQVAEKQDGERKVTSYENIFLKCRWAFDVNKEMLDPLPGSKGVVHKFYISPEGTLHGVNKNILSRTDDKSITFTRPACFFFLNARHDRWADQLAHPDAIVTPSTTADGKHRILITERGSQLTYELDLGSDFMLTGAKATMNGRDLWVLQIHQFTKNSLGAKRFPTDATITLFNPAKNWEKLREDRLRAISVTFPSSLDQVRTAFDFTLPKGTVVADPELGKAIQLSKASGGKDVIQNPANAHPVIPLIQAPTGTVESAATADSGIHGLLMWPVWLAFASAVVCGCGVLLLRKARWKAAGN